MGPAKGIGFATGLLFIGIYSLPSLAQDSRDEDIFGEGAPAASSEQPKGAESDTEKSLRDTLQIGGRLEISLSSQKAEGEELKQAKLSHLKTADIYFDSRPEKNLRVFLRTRISENSQEVRCIDQTCLKIDEAWFKWNDGETAFYTLGKQHIKWGSSRFWNPTDFTAGEGRDPLALIDRRLGREMLKVHIPDEKNGHNYYLILEWDDAERNESLGLALRGEFTIGSSAELAISAATRSGAAQKLGVDVSTAAGPLDLTLETAVVRRTEQQFYRGGLEVSPVQLPEAYSQKSKIFLQSVLGLRHSLKYSSDDQLSLGLEFFANGLGYEDRELALYSMVRGDSARLYAGRKYLGAYLQLPNPGSWNKSSFLLNGLYNANDESALLQLSGSWTFRNFIKLDGYLSHCWGAPGELCFKVPSAYRDLANAPGVGVEWQEILPRLPERAIHLTAGVSASMDI